MHERDEKCIQNFGQKILKGRDDSGELDTDERIILRWILKVYVLRTRIRFIWPRIVYMTGCYDLVMNFQVLQRKANLLFSNG
jgi:hypothetical protein